MKLRTLIRRSLRFHWRSHLGVVLGAAIGSAALIGALVVGDSVKGSLKERALERLGNIHFAMSPGDRLFRAQLAGDFHNLYTNVYREFYGGSFAPALRLPATISSGDGSARANQANLIGVDEGWLTMGGDVRFSNGDLNGVWLNVALANHLGVSVGDMVLVRATKPTALSQETPVSPKSDQVMALRLAVLGVVTASALGDFNLVAGQMSPFNAFVHLSALQAAVGASNRANLLLVSEWEADMPRPLSHLERVSRFFKPLTNTLSVVTATGKYDAVLQRGPLTLDMLNSPHEFRRVLQLADSELVLRTSAFGDEFELTSPRIFLEPAVGKAAQFKVERAGKETARYIAVGNQAKANEIALGEMMAAGRKDILTYLVNLLRAGTNATPYSMVTAAGAPWTPADLRDDEIVVSQWLAEDLHLKPGDEIAVSYFLPESGAKLTEATNTFRVRSIVPPEMPWADRTLMPDFPGIEKAESTSEWDAGFPLTYKVRDKDDAYWKKFRGTPKAFLTLAAGQKMWGNRFGNLTAIRFPIPTNAPAPLTPALSPSEGERENRPLSQPKSETAVSSTDSGKPTNGQVLSPLPGGEGQGEGERQTNFVENYRAALEKKILASLKPEELGLRFEPVREQALKAAEQSQDFGGLFLGFSFFVIAAALLLMALLFSLGLEQRAPEIGTLLALGFTPKQVRSLLLREGVALSFLGGLLGALGGLAYAKGMLSGLTTIWRDAVGASSLSFHFTAQTLAIGLLASVVVSALTIWFTLRKFVKRPARELLVGEVGMDESKVQSLKSKIIAIGALLAGVALVGWAIVSGDMANAGSFFGAGSLVLVAGLSFASAWLARRTGIAPVANRSGTTDGDRRDASPTFTSLAVRGCARRRKRSLSTVAMLACGSFLIVSIGVFRLDANRDASRKNSGTGGFALIGETTMPVVQDLNSQSGREFFALNERDLTGVNFVPFRVREGDEASCLNLNRAQKPRLLGVRSEMLEGRFGFAKGEEWAALRENRGWRMEDGKGGERSDTTEQSSILNPPSSPPEIPAIGDANSIQWAMGKKVGDTIDYVDERGQLFKVRIVGAVANSILQGQLIIDEAEFVKRFPGESGYRMFLMDAPSNAVTQVSASLSRALQDVGLELTLAPARLAQFNAVQNTYLGTFQVLGGLGLLLGSVGLGIVVLRNVLERRGELALLMAVGFRKQQLHRLLLLENGALLATGLALGVAAAAVAVLPAMFSPGAQLPFASLALTLGAVLLNGVLWTWAATRFAVRGDLLKALRNE